ncbi:microcystin degradation protein MlrC [Breoghania corrubedonensis]|uniref:Microcystinase C n=1 Tax=Breoghania corrubedonensis TaxID=665038 RepID=A0A2T5V7X1_9HYPH|nr:M81 family metallopeptidase [Breoghania corrubedonensis]PTW59849.1 microcystin degradation protein MlrC [Breoghania corrubedonensis]
MAKRIAIAGFLHETNTFAPSPATLEDFVQGGGHLPMCRGADIITRARGVNVGIAGAIEYGESKGWVIEPLLWAGAIPSAHVEVAAFEGIAGEMLDRLATAGPVDGIYLDLHGAMVCEHLDDGEGALIERVRKLVGPDVPITVSLDLHGNVTPRMMENADVLVAYRTYPHVDMAETGRRAAEQLDALMARARSFAKAFRQLPYLIPIPWQCTGLEPATRLYDAVRNAEDGPVVSTSYLMGFPAADFEDCAQSVLAYAWTQEEADRTADALRDLVLAAEGEFAGHAYGPDEGVREAMRIADGARRPVVIADTQDNPGAGGNSDTTGMLRALVRNKAQRAAIGLIVDPQAARFAHEAGEGAMVSLALGGKSGIPGDEPFEAGFRVESLSNGRVRANGPYYGGTFLELGLSACLSIGGVRVVVASRKAQLADQAMYRFVGIEPRDQAILVNKSSVHFRADFETIAETIMVCTAPGPMALDPADLPWSRLKPGMRMSPKGPAFKASMMKGEPA